MAGACRVDGRWRRPKVAKLIAVIGNWPRLFTSSPWIYGGREGRQKIGGESIHCLNLEKHIDLVYIGTSRSPEQLTISYSYSQLSKLTNKPISKLTNQS